MARQIVLDFERPIFELEQKIEDLRRYSQRSSVDVDASVELLREKLARTRADVYGALTPWQKVQLARHPERPYAMDYIAQLCTDFYELHGDRCFADDQAVLGGFAKLDGRKIMVVGQQKGRDVKENVDRNFGMPHPEGYRKALRLMQLADKARTPIVALIDTPGAFPGIGSEERHVGEAIAVNLREMFNLGVPVVCLVIGEGGSGGALGISVGNRLLVMEHAYYSVITPEGCAAILWKSSDETEAAAEALKLTAQDLSELGLIDEIVREPEGGANQDPAAAAAAVGEALGRHLEELAGMSPDELRVDRYAKFRRMGIHAEAPPPPPPAGEDNG